MSIRTKQVLFIEQIKQSMTDSFGNLNKCEVKNLSETTKKLGEITTVREIFILLTLLVLQVFNVPLDCLERFVT